jgi:hypothetical protein
MGKLKESLIIEQEQQDINRSGGLNVCGLDLSDEELATIDKEFNAWLDAYEASFGDNHD